MPQTATVDNRVNGSPKIVATYDYRDERGILLYQVVRLEPGEDGARKTFRQRRPDGRDRWIWGLGDTRRVLYRLPELLDSLPEQHVFIPEGEKDVDNLRALDIVATTNAMGAGKWRPEYADNLRGRNVAILPDNDEPGKNHAKAVAQSLRGIAKSVTILELPGLPPKGDVSNWLDQGNDKIALLNLLKLTIEAKEHGDAWEGEPVNKKEAKPSFPAIKRCSELQLVDDSKKWLWHGCLARGSTTLFSALWKSGKTTFISYLLRAFQFEKRFCGLEISPASVLFVTEESEGRWAERRDELSLGDHVSFFVRPFVGKPNYAGWMEFIDHLKKEIQKNPVDLLVFDTLSNLWSVRDENDAAQVQEALMPLHQLTDNAALLLVHHLRKGDGKEATGSRGSGALTSWVDVILELRRYDAANRHDRRRVVTGYGRWDGIPEEVVCELLADKSGYVAHGDRQEVSVREMRATIVSLVPCEPPGRTTEEIHDDWPEKPAPTNKALRDELQRGTDAGDWKREGEGKKGSPFTYWISPPV